MSAATKIDEQNNPDDSKNEPIDEQNKPVECNSEPSDSTFVFSQLPNSSLRHLVLGGILIVFFTFYITAASILCYKEGLDEEMKFENIVNTNQKENNGRAEIWEKLLEKKMLCSELEIFMKDLNLDWNEHGYPYCTNDTESGIVIEFELEVNTVVPEAKDNGEDISASVDKKNIKITKNGNSGTRNDKNGNGREKFTNKSTKLRRLIKNLEKDNKEQTKKKNSTAEPIIYLFALVFIYLLIKAASDINQHYKSQSKGDKRLRRCSLQSYAQTHKQDRRASKDTPLTAFKNKHILMEQRSQSLDRTGGPLTEEMKKKSEILNNLRKYTSTEESTQETFSTPTAQRSNLGTDPTIFGNTLNSLSDGNMSPSRRCSVPSLLTSQKQKFGSATAIIAMNRRSSIVSGSSQYGSNAGILGSLGGSFDSADTQFPENKRRVRMINRH